MSLLGSYSSKRQNVFNRAGRHSPFWIWDVAFALLLFALISGVRWNVGVDHQHYLANYLTLQNGGYFLFEKEPGFEFLTRLFAESGVHFSFYFGFLAFLQIFFIYRAFKNEQYLYPFLGIVIIFGGEYLSWMNGIRQMLAATVFVWSIKFIRNRQLLKYLLAIGMASLMHRSALMLLIFYFVPQKDFFKNRTVTFILVGIALLLGNMSFWINSLKGFSDLLAFLGYDWYAENIELLMKEEQARNLGPRRLSLIMVALATIWFSPKLKETFSSTYFLTYYNFGILGFLLFNLFGNTHHVFIRPTTYLTIFSIPTTAYLLVYLRTNLAKKYVHFYIILLCAIAYLPISIIADNGKGRQDYTNYRFYWYNSHS